MDTADPSELSPNYSNSSSLYGGQANPFAPFPPSSSSQTSQSTPPSSLSSLTPQLNSTPSAPAPSYSAESLKPSGSIGSTNAAAPLSMSTSFTNPTNPTSSGSNAQAQIVQKQLQQLNLYRNQQLGQLQQQQTPQPAALGSSQQLSQIQSQIQQQQIGQQQQQLQQFMNTMLENFDRLNKCLADVDNRISSLEKATREIMVNQKTQKEVVQQQLQQILQKLGDVRQTIPQPNYVTPAMPAPMMSPVNIGGTIAIPAPAASYTPANFSSGRDIKREQEDSDAELARRLQAELNAENSRTSAPSRPVEPTEECPLCNEKVPKSGLEAHVNKHFDEEPTRSAAAANSAEGGLWSKLFGNKQAEAEKKKQEEEARLKKQKEEEELLRNKKKQESQQQPMQAIPYQAPYYLAPAFQSGVPVVYRPDRKSVV